MTVGLVAPFWVPDEDAPGCQECQQKFTVLRRRHHCRACGRVLCAACCHDRAPLPYMDNKEARVCASCLALINAPGTDHYSIITFCMDNDVIERGVCIGLVIIRIMLMDELA